MKVVIGLIPLVDETKESYWMLPGYMKVIEQAGGIPIILPLTDDKAILKQALSLCDGLLLTGGHDVSPSIYNAEAIPECGTPCNLRDAMEGYLLDCALDNDIPVLGICRGIQFINAHLGGTLYQDLPSQHPSSITHQMTKPYNRVVHDVTLVEGSYLYNLLKVDTLGVNSYHHQAIYKLAPSLVAAAYSPDGLVEAAYLPNKRYVLGIQWHPELSYENDPISVSIIRDFITKCEVV